MAYATHARFKAVMDLPYTPPTDATPDGIRKAEELIQLPVVAKKKNKVRPPDLDVICREYDPKPSQRFKPGRGSKLRNKAFLIALILKGMGHESAVMPEWWTPEDKVPPPGKRDSPEPESPSDGSTATELDWGNLAKNHEHNPKANIDLDRRADKYQYDYSINKTMKGSVDQSKTAFEPHELADFVERVSNMPDSSESATCLAFIGLTLQSLSRPRQLCEVTRDNIRLYPDTDMHEDADFGPVTMVGVSDRGHLKQDRMAKVTHWVSRCRRPKVTDPVFAMAMKQAMDVGNDNGKLRGDLLQAMQHGAKGV